MKLLTKAIEKALPRLYANEDRKAEDTPVVVKFFTPDANCTWWITEGNPEENGDWTLFGLCDLGLGFPELGYVMLSEIQGIRGRLGLPVERDLHYRASLADAMKTAGA